MNKPFTYDQMKQLAGLVNDGTTTVFVPTPKGWKCKKKGCPTQYLQLS